MARGLGMKNLRLLRLPPIVLSIALIIGLLLTPMQISVRGTWGSLGISIRTAAAGNGGSEPEIGEVIEARGQTSKTYYLGDGTYSTQARLGPAHYQGTQDNWQEIDNAWVTGILPWDWQMEQDSYYAYALNHFTYGQVMKFGSRDSAVAFQPMNLDWTNDLSQIEVISIPQDVPVLVNNIPVELLDGMEGSLGSIRWNNAYGSGRHFEWTTAPGMLRTLLQLDVIPAAPPQYIIDGGNPVLRQSFIFAPSSELDIYVNDSLWDKKTKVQTVQDIEFRRDGEIFWYFWCAKYWDSSEGDFNVATTILRRAGNDLWLDVLVPYEWLQTALYPVFIDPDTGATLPGLGSTEDNGGKRAWTDPTNIETEADYAVGGCDGKTWNDWLRASDFGFSVPGGATIDGVKVEINRYCTTANDIVDEALYLVDDDGNNGSVDQDASGFWPTSPATQTYGGSTQPEGGDAYWGLTLTPSLVNDSDFGCRLSVYNTDKTYRVAIVYWVKITVYYTAPPADPDISVSPVGYSFGTVAESSTYNTTTSYFTITNASSMETDQTIGVTSSNWTGGLEWYHSETCTPGGATAGLKSNRSGTWGTGDVIVKYSSPNYIYENCPASTNYDFGLSLHTPTIFTDGVLKEITVTITAAAS